MRYLIFIFILTCTDRTVVAGGVESSWFKPVLTENKDPACGELLKDARKKFFSDSTFYEAYGVRGYGYSENGTILNWQIIGGPSPLEVTAFGKTFYLDYLNHGGCGGACETNQPLVSDKPFPKTRNLDYLQALAENAPPAVSYEYTIARASENGVYLFAVTNKDQILIYRLAREARWAPACKISTAPKTIPQSADERLLKSLESLHQTVVGGFMRGAGNCGSMQTHLRWGNDVSNALRMVLYRPWVLREQNPGADVDGSYNNDMKYLEQWSLLGISEFDSFQQFQEQLNKTTNQLAVFLHKVNGWPLDDATKMASDALKGAVSIGIRFYMYDPQFAQGEEAIRRAILDKRDIRAVRNITFDAANLDATMSGDGGPESRETVLSIAIEYPEALSLLLDKGINPDHVNDFGKTPLMYAAQFNQLKSARLLIKRGADINAVTTEPSDSCYYTLRTFNMTPLHYAVRYASPDLIRLLLDSGAQPFVKAENHNHYPMVKETPLDWLHRYTGANATEKNPNISDAQVAEIEKWLAPLTPEQALTKAEEYMLKAETDYQSGNAVQAYRYASLARQLQPDNHRALYDLSLNAMNIGKFGESMEVSQQLIESDASDTIRANAWFNQGLACEQYKVQTNQVPLTFNGNEYCTYGVVYPYLKAYQTAPSPAHMNKLKMLFDNHVVPYCEIHTGTGTLKINFQMGNDPKSRSYQKLQTIYVLHRSTQKVTGEDLAWDLKFRGGEVKRIVPEKVTTLTLYDKVMSIFETPNTYVRFPYQAFGTTCTLKDSMEIPNQ